MAKKSLSAISLMVMVFFALVFIGWGCGGGGASRRIIIERNGNPPTPEISIVPPVNSPDDDDDDDDDNDNDDDDDDGSPSTPSTPDGDDDDDDDDGDNDNDDDDDDGSPSTPNTPDGDDDDDDNDGDDDDDDDDDGVTTINNSVSSARYGSLLMEVNENPTLAGGAATRILKAAGARPLGHTPASQEMSSTTQSSYVPGGRVSDPSYFLAERDASGDLQFTFKRRLGGAVTALSTTDGDASARRADNLASGWKGVEVHHDKTDGVFNWDAYTDSQGNSDSDYLSLGSWLFIYKDPNDGSYTGSYALGVAAGGNDPFENSNLAGLTGTASYRGLASGLHMSKADSGADPVFDYFDARANLSVDFGDATALGSVSGTITGGRTDGGVSLPALTLGAADIIGGALGGNFDGDTGGTTSGGGALSGKWGGKFFGNRADPASHPGSVAGAFGANTEDDLLSIVGAFGAKRTP